MRRFALCVVLAVSVLLLAAAPAGASRASVAALQAGLQALDLYEGYVDGIKGPLTRHAIAAFQRSHGLAVDGVAGPRTRQALGWRGRPRLGSRGCSQATAVGTSPHCSTCCSARATGPAGPTASSGR